MEAIGWIAVGVPDGQGVLWFVAGAGLVATVTVVAGDTSLGLAIDIGVGLLVFGVARGGERGVEEAGIAGNDAAP